MTKRFFPELEILEDRNLLSTFFWTGADKTSLWSDPKNWLDAATGKPATRAPGMLRKVRDDFADFDRTKASVVALRNVTVDKPVAYLDLLQIDDRYNGTVSVDYPLSTRSALLNSEISIINGTSKLILKKGDSSWNVGTIKGIKLVVSQGATLIVTGNQMAEDRFKATLNDGAVLENQGIVQLTDATILVGGNSAIRNALVNTNTKFGLQPARFEMDGDAQVLPAAGGSGFFINRGLLLASPENSVIGVLFKDAAPSKVEGAGEVKLRSGIQANAEPGELTLSGGGIIGDGAVFDQSGTDRADVTFTGSRAYLLGNATFDGGTFVTYTWTDATANVFLAQDTAKFKAKLILSTKSEVAGPGTFLFDAIPNAPFQWQDGGMTGTGKTIIGNAVSNSASVMEIGNPAGNPTLTVSQRTIENFGTIEVRNAGTTKFSEGAKLINQAHNAKVTDVLSTVNFMDDSGITGDAASSITNYGIFEKSAGPNVSKVDVKFVNGKDSELISLSGTLKIPEGKQVGNPSKTTEKGRGKLSSDDPYLLEAGIFQNIGLSALDGEFIGDVLSTGGEVDPGGVGSTGILTIDGVNGTYTQRGHGSLKIDIAGPTPGTQYDRLVVTGAVTLGGTLNIYPTPGFTGDYFDILVNQSGQPIVGRFNGLPEGAELTLDGRQFFITYHGGASGNDVVLFTAVAPTLTTTPGGPVDLGSGQNLTDSATLSGGINPTGTITFQLYDPSNTLVYTDAVTVNGDGTYTTDSGNNPGGYSPTELGTFQWVVTYSGDANNASVISPLGSEPETVGSGSSGISGPVLSTSLSTSEPASWSVRRITLPPGWLHRHDNPGLGGFFGT